MWNNKQKRAYHRAKSGVKVAEILKLHIKHLVLTTSPEGQHRNITNDFQILRKRIYRKFGFLLAYFLVHTNEGYGVLHIIYRNKGYLPQRWVSHAWDDIHKSSYVYIKEVPDNDIARYVVTQYIADQGTSFQRSSWSHNWVCKGFVKAWKKHLRWYHQWHLKIGLDFIDLITKWELWIQNQVIKQTTLF